MNDNDDAKRYRWLRDNAALIEFVVEKTDRDFNVFYLFGDDRRPEELDKAIDMAILKSIEK